MLVLVLRVILSLAVVLGLFWMVARTGSRKLGGRDRALIRVRGRQSLSRSSSLAVVEVGSRVLVVGVSDGGVRLLTEMDPAELAPAAQGSSAPPEIAESTLVIDEVPDPVSDGVLDQPADQAPDEDFQAAYERAVAEVATKAPVVVADQPTHPAPVADVQGPLAGSLLSGSTWRQAWDTATGRGQRTQPGDAA